MKYLIIKAGKYIQFETEYDVSFSRTKVLIVNADNKELIVKRYFNLEEWIVACVNNDEVRIISLTTDGDGISDLIEDLKKAGIEVKEN